MKYFGFCPSHNPLSDKAYLINFIFDFIPVGGVACRTMSMINLEVILLQEVALSRDPFCRKPNADMGIDHLG